MSTLTPIQLVTLSGQYRDYIVGFFYKTIKADSDYWHDFYSALQLKILDKPIDYIEEKGAKSFIKQSLYNRHIDVIRSRDNLSTVKLEVLLHGKKYAALNESELLEDMGHCFTEAPAFDNGGCDLHEYITKSALKDKAKQVIELFYFKDASIKDIQQIMNMGESNVKFWLMQTRSDIAKLLAKQKINSLPKALEIFNI